MAQERSVTVQVGGKRCVVSDLRWEKSQSVLVRYPEAASAVCSSRGRNYVYPYICVRIPGGGLNLAFVGLHLWRWTHHILGHRFRVVVLRTRAEWLFLRYPNVQKARVIGCTGGHKWGQTGVRACRPWSVGVGRGGRWRRVEVAEWQGRTWRSGKKSKFEAQRERA